MKNEEVKIIGRGSCIEQNFSVPKDKIFLETFIVRVGKQMMSEWKKSLLEHYTCDFDKKEEWEAYLEKKRKVKEECENKIMQAIDIDKQMYLNVNVQHITHNLFTITTILKIE